MVLVLYYMYVCACVRAYVIQMYVMLRRQAFVVHVSCIMLYTAYDQE